MTDEYCLKCYDHKQWTKLSIHVFYICLTFVDSKFIELVLCANKNVHLMCINRLQLSLFNLCLRYKINICHFTGLCETGFISNLNFAFFLSGHEFIWISCRIWFITLALYFMVCFYDFNRSYYSKIPGKEFFLLSIRVAWFGVDFGRTFSYSHRNWCTRCVGERRCNVSHIRNAIVDRSFNIFGTIFTKFIIF